MKYAVKLLIILITTCEIIAGNKFHIESGPYKRLDIEVTHITTDAVFGIINGAPNQLVYKKELGKEFK